jgi:hypothetical protein
LRKLVSTLLLTGIVLITQINSFPQTRDSLIQLYPGIGDTIYSFDREYFELFQNVDGFEYAVFYIRDKNELVSKVTFNFEGILKDTVSTYGLQALENVRSTIRKIDGENNKKLDSPREVIIFTKDENQYKGLLEMFSKKNLYLISSEQTDYRYKIPISNVDRIFLTGESNVLASVGIGALIGIAVGAVIGYVASDEGDYFGGKGGGATISGAFFGLVGAIIGLIAGFADSESDQEIKIEKDSDILELKRIAYYYFIYNETREMKYIEIK